MADDGVEIWPVAGLEFGMKQFSIGVDFKRAATRRNKRERFDPVSEFENFCRQTDGFRRVVSNHAIFDRDLGLHSNSFPMKWYEDRAKRSRHPSPARDMRPSPQPAGLGNDAQIYLRCLTISGRGRRFTASFFSVSSAEIVRENNKHFRDR